MGKHVEPSRNLRVAKVFLTNHGALWNKTKEILDYFLQSIKTNWIYLLIVPCKITMISITHWVTIKKMTMTFDWLCKQLLLTGRCTCMNCIYLCIVAEKYVIKLYLLFKIIDKLVAYAKTIIIRLLTLNFCQLWWLVREVPSQTVNWEKP